MLLTIISDNHWNITGRSSTQHQHRFLCYWFRCRCDCSCWSHCWTYIFAIVGVAWASYWTILLNYNFNVELKIYIYKVKLYRTVCISYDSTNLAGAICRAAFELSDTFIFAITIILTVVNASCQGHSIDIQTFVPVGIFSDILNGKYEVIELELYFENWHELTEHSHIEFSQPSQPLGQSMSQGQPQWNFKFERMKTGSFKLGLRRVLTLA